jgi:hypothetical protein
MSDIDKAHLDADCECFECNLTKPHYLAQALSHMVEILVGQKDSDKVRKDMEVLVKLALCLSETYL